MLTVRIHLPWKTDKTHPLLRQTPRERGIWKDVQFYINEGPEKCDFIAVFAGQHGVIREPLRKENTLFIAGEPPAIKQYSEAYLAQFGSVICSDPKSSHPNKKLSQQGYTWFCGIEFLTPTELLVKKTYDDYQRDTHITKTKLLSVVCSDKCSKPGHRKRFEFVKKLEEVFGDEMDLFGTGQNPIADKAEAIRPYKYHIAIENSSAPDYWTEKLADCYLEGAYPLYAGCPNLNDYFKEDAYTLINLENPIEAIKTIQRTIETNTYEKSLSALIRAKQQVLDDYNLFNLITEHVKGSANTTNHSTSKFKAYPHKWFHKGLRFRIKFMLQNLHSRLSQ